jgi:NADH-quinone oxidoreductase subunit J
MVEVLVFLAAAAIILGGAIGVVVFNNPVHAALSLVGTLFGVAVSFVAQDAHFLAAVQVIVYAGAIVVLFLFVIMLLGVDQVEDLKVEPLAGQRPAAVIAGVAVLGLSLVALVIAGGTTGLRPSDSRAIEPSDSNNITELARVLFTKYAFAFEATAILLTIAVVGAVVLARRAPSGEDQPAETGR